MLLEVVFMNVSNELASLGEHRFSLSAIVLGVFLGKTESLR